METDSRFVLGFDRTSKNDREIAAQTPLQVSFRHNHGDNQKNWLGQWYIFNDKGLYTGQETNADFYSDRDKKVAYLQKAIKLVELMTGEAIEAKPQKIVAGLEPEV